MAGLALLFYSGVNAMPDDATSSLHDGIPARLLRIAFGVALFAALFFFLGSSGAFAAQDSPASAHQSSSKGKGLISGLLDPIINVVDKTISQVPVVKDLTGNNTGSQVVAPVVTITDKVENTVAVVPVVNKVVAPVRNITNSVVPPVVNVVEAISTPVLGTVEQVTAPVVKVVAPIVDPVTGTLKPVVDGVTGTVPPVVDGVTEVIDQVLPTVKPSAPGTPSTPGTPGTVTPGTPGNGGAGNDAPETTTPGIVILPGSGLNPSNTDTQHSDLSPSMDEAGKSIAGHAEAGATQVAALRSGLAPSTSSPLGSLAQYLASEAIPGTSNVSNDVAMAVPSLPLGSVGNASCDSDFSELAIGPCAPAVSASPAPAAGSGSGAGGNGGPSGPAAADENFAGHVSIAVQGATLGNADWPLPASMPSNPGSTPG